jgi:hypothetical protein
MYLPLPLASLLALASTKNVFLNDPKLIFGGVA